MHKSIALILPLAAIAAPALAEKVSITIGADALPTIEQHFPLITSQRSFVSSGNNDVIALQVSESLLPAISEVMHHHHNRCGGFIVHEDFETARSAAWFDQTLVLESVAASYTINNEETTGKLQANILEPSIRSTIESLASFTNRYYTTESGLEGARWIKDKWETLTTNRSDTSVEFFNHSWQQPSVILTIEGRTAPDEIVVLGAHLDSIAGSNTNASTRAPGADDDASGIATLTSLIEAITKTGYYPDKTIKFMGYAAEEVGLRGSKDIAASFKRQGINVVGMLQLDMTNYKGSSGDIYIIEDYTNAAQNQFLSDLANYYQPEITLGFTECGYACSDHASWYYEGFPASFPFEATFNGANPHIHTARDTLSQSNNNANHAVKFGKLAAAYVAELAKGGMNTDPDPGDEVTESFTGGVTRNQQDDYGPFIVAPGTSFTADLTGTNDADLYVRYNTAPTPDDFDCRPYKDGSDEVCQLTVPANSHSAYVAV